jgi:signal transduction histidine kinase
VRRRLVSSTAAIALASVIVLGVPLGIVEAARVRSDATARLEREADAVATAIDDRLESHRPLSPAALARFVRPGHRVVIATRTGHLTVGAPLHGDVTRVRAGASQSATVTAEALASEASDRVARAWLLIAGLAFGGVAAAVALAYVQARRLARPLESLAETSTQLGQGDFSTRAGRFSIPEVDALAQVLDASAGRIARLVGREREFSANVSHQLRTPITALRLRLDELALQADASAAERAEVEAALAEVDRLESTISGLLAYAREASAGEAVELDLGDLTRRHAATWEVLFRRAGRHLVLDSAAPVTVTASPAAVGQVLDVLLDNALHHGAGRALVTVGDDGLRALVAVEDEGAGIPPDLVDGIFARGSSSDGDGTGIGLHLAQVLAEAEGGRLVLASSAPPRFELTLPHRMRESAHAS